MKANELYKQGKLHEAIAEITNQIKSSPTDLDARMFFIELLCFAQQYDRADKQLETLGRQTTKAPITLALYRQILRGESAREQVLREGRAPELIGELPEYAKQTLEALVAQRLGQSDDTQNLIATAQSERPATPCKCNDQPVADFSDLDDRVAGVLECITNTGKYYWVPFNKIVSLEFNEPEVPLDLIWRKTQISVLGGPDGEVYVPTRYVSDPSDDEALLLGRATDWVDDQPIVTGKGLRTFAVDEQEMTIMEIKSLSFASHPDEPDDE